MPVFSYTARIFRPPAEADSLILQLAIGCPHNTCCFCGMYKGVRYHQRPVTEMLAYIAEAARIHPETKRIFLADGDIMALPFSTLKQILQACNHHFPNLARITTYANASSITQKTPDEIADLRALKLSIVYIGMETGDDELLHDVHKAETSDDMIKAVHLVQKEGIKASVMILLGLGGKTGSRTHIVKTADVLNRMQPRLLSALRLIEVPGVHMYDGYETLSEYQSVQELRDLIAKLNLTRTVFTANHASIPVPVKGRLPHDQQNLLKLIDQVLALSQLDRKGPGTMPYSL